MPLEKAPTVVILHSLFDIHNSFATVVGMTTPATASRPVRTRFAPSPTGYMHIGGMRTALFNWLWAKHCGGTFILRVDDTDQQRNLDSALGPILNAFRWLGLQWDEGPEVGGPHAPYFQSQRRDRYRQMVEQLLTAGTAWLDFDPPELTKADRTTAEAEKRTYLNVRRSLELSDAERRRRVAEGQPHVVRLLVPRDQSVSTVDHVRGRVTWDCGLIADPVIVRGDGSPLYNFASVVDDIDFEISHVIRAEEHLTNTATQLLVFQACGVAAPEFAHIPFVAAPGTTKKMSKRDLAKYQSSPHFKRLFDISNQLLPKLGLTPGETMNPVMVEFYEKVGFLPSAVLNTLARLGWSLDDKTEFMSLEFLTREFTLDRVVKSFAGLDVDKLFAFQEHWCGKLSATEITDHCLPFLVTAGWVSAPVSAEDRDFVTRVVQALGERLKLFGEILSYEEYFVSDERWTIDEAAFSKRLQQAPASVDLLREFAVKLRTTETFAAADLDRLLHQFVAEKNVAMNQIIHALRIAVTGKAIGPGMFDCLALLGKEKCLRRIAWTLNRLNTPSVPAVNC